VLSDQEREALHEIQHQLLVEDPGFAQSFDTEARSFDTEPQRLHRGSPDQTRRTYTILLVLSLTCGVIMLLSGSPISALGFAAMAAAIWEVRRRRDTTNHQRP
jgi:hypothetical protein